MVAHSSSHEEASQVSVVIPTFNSAPWLPSTLAALEKSLKRTSWSAEVIIVDDGSTDESLNLLASIQPTFGYPMRIISQSNQGRFLARWAGANAASFPNMMLLDSRILLGEKSLEHVEKVGLNPAGSRPRAWNGHSITDPSANLIGHFWEVPTYVFWGQYLSNPVPTMISAENFNSVPKGTTFFICPTEIFINASRQHWPEENANLTNDDTKIIRQIVSEAEVLIDPGFWALYRPRTNIRAFVKHTFARGTTFVDGFAGISMKTNLAILGAAVAPVIACVSALLLIFTGNILLLGILFLLALVGLSVPAVVAATNRCPGKGIRSYFAYALTFALPYWAGIIRGVKLHGSALFHTRRNIAEGTSS